MVDTNSNPKLVDFPIPANDDASKSVAIIMDYVTNAIIEGLEERKTAKSKLEAEKKAEETKKKEAKEKADSEKAEIKEAAKETKVEDKTEVKAEDKSE